MSDLEDHWFREKEKYKQGIVTADGLMSTANDIIIRLSIDVKMAESKINKYEKCEDLV